MEQHNKYGVGYTSIGRPWDLIWFKIFRTKCEAMSLENKLKNLSRKRKIAFMIKYKDHIAQELTIKALNELK